MLKNPHYGLFLMPGLGKSSITLAAIKILKKERKIRKVLIVAPLRVCHSVWPTEASKWSDFSQLKTVVLHGKDKEKNLYSDADIFCINPEGLPFLFKRKDFKKLGFDMLVVDESSKFKYSNTKRFKLLRSVLPTFSRRYILTGSPAANSLLDLFGQIYIIDLGKSLGKFVTHYRSTYFYQTGFGGYTWSLQKGANKLIQDKIRPITLSMDDEDYLELPDLIINDVFIDLDEKSRAIYKEMEEDLIAAIRRKEVVASSAAVASGKCSQIANGSIYDEDRKVHHIHDFKAEAVMDIIDELGGSPTLVAYEYGHDLERLKTVLGKDVPYIGGGVTPKKAAQIEAQWNAGELPVLLGQPASVAHGLNLQQAGNNVIWYSLPWSFEHYDQFVRRVRRQGNIHNRVIVHRIIARDTVDELKIQALNNKFRTQKDLFDALNNFLRRKPFTSGEKSGKLDSGQETSNVTKGKSTMSKFGKKPENAEAVQKSVEPAKRPKLWTNNSDWQDQDTGETTAEGRAQITKTSTNRKAKEAESEAAETKSKKEPKMTKQATAKKPAKEAASTKVRAGKEEKAAPKASNDDRKIIFVQKENPKRGSAAERFALYQKGMTISEYVKKGGKKADVSWDAKQGFIKVSVK